MGETRDNPVEDCARFIYHGFLRYNDDFGRITRRAGHQFVSSDWLKVQSDLVERMGSKSESYRRAFAEQKGFGGYAYEKLERYIERSPAHQAHRLQTPVLIHLASNDTDVRINETMHLIDALKAAGKDFEYEIYEDPPGGHSFNRINTATAAESWEKIKAFPARRLE